MRSIVRGLISGPAGSLALVLGLLVLVAWPATATVLEAVRASRATDADDLASISTDPAAGLLRAGTMPRSLRLALESLGLVAGAVGLAVPLGTLLAVLLARTDLAGRNLWLVLLSLAAFVPLPLHATAWLGAFGNAGRQQAFGLAPILVGRFGAAVVHALAALPWVVVLVALGLRAVEPELEEQARLEMSSIRVLWSVTLRRALAAIAAACLAVAVLTGGDMTVTDLLQVRTYAEESYLAYSLGLGPGGAAAVTLPPLLLLAVAIALLMRVLAAIDPARLASPRTLGRQVEIGRARGLISLATGLVLACLVALPLATLLWRAGRVGGNAALGQGPSWSITGLAGTLRQAWSDLARPLGYTLLLASAAGLIATALAWGLAWKARRARAWAWGLVAVLALLLAAPGPVVGMALVLAYRGFHSIYNSSLMIIMAESARALPFAILLLWPFVRAFPRDHLDAAALDGLNPARQLLQVALPLLKGPLAAAWVVCVVVALGELPATNLATPPGTPPVSVLLWGLLHTGVESRVAGVALLLLGVIAALGLVAVLAVRNAARAEAQAAA